MPPEWLYGAFIGLALVHLLVAVRAYRAREAAVQAEAVAATDGLECETCGAVNEPSYRFCRECVSELPGRAPVVGGGASPGERGRVL